MTYKPMSKEESEVNENEIARLRRLASAVPAGPRCPKCGGIVSLYDQGDSVSHLFVKCANNHLFDKPGGLSFSELAQFFAPSPATGQPPQESSRTYGELPGSIRNMIEPHEWDNKNISEQRDYALDMVDFLERELGNFRRNQAAAQPESAAKVEEIAAEIIRTLRPADPGSWAMNMPYVVARLRPYIPSQPPADADKDRLRHALNHIASKKCGIYHQGPGGVTCLEQVDYAKRNPERYEQKFRQEILELVHCCDSCYAKIMLAAPVTPVSQPGERTFCDHCGNRIYFDAGGPLREVWRHTGSNFEHCFGGLNTVAKPAVAQVSGNGTEPEVAANTPCSDHKFFNPACGHCWQAYYKSSAFRAQPTPKGEK